MDQVQDLLFGQAPRRVGTPNQHWCWSVGQIDFFIGSVNGRRNAYATLGWWDFEESAMVADKVLYDLDSPAKSEEHENGDWRIFDADPPDDEVIDRMRNDPDLAEEILGPVCEDARELARRSRNDNVPVVGVFSGFGIHIHQLFEPTYHPTTAMATTAHRYIDRLDLQTPDRSILGQPERICRIPNCERIAGSVKDNMKVVDGRPTNLYTIPLSAAELAAVSPEWLLDESHSPRTDVAPDGAERPEMHVWEDYETGHEETADVPPRPLNPEETEIAEDADIRALLERLLRMPRMVERLVDDPDPDHDVRVNATVMLLNTGLTPQTVVDLFERVGWIDFNRSKTRQYVEGIYKSGYSDQNCQTLRGKGLCTRSDDPESCPCFGWSGGKAEWKT